MSGMVFELSEKSSGLAFIPSKSLSTVAPERETERDGENKFQMKLLKINVFLDEEYTLYSGYMTTCGCGTVL